MIKRVVGAVVALVMVVSALVFSAPQQALAGDAAVGAKIFSNNCAACHIGGGNVVNAQKTLKKDALAQFSMDSIEAITTQVTNGKNAMPSFKGKLDAAQIEDVATYVLAQAEKGW